MSRRLLIPTALLLLFLVLAGILDAAIPHPDLTDQDIYYSYLEGRRLLHGNNPYGRILHGDMVNNDKYATYFPVFYELSFLTQKLGLVAFEPWFALWMVVFIVFELAIAVLLFWALLRCGLPWGGLFAAGFWLFNRWTLQVLQIGHLDFLPIFFLLLSLELLPRKKWLALFFFSLSLGLKQIAIFLAPLYLIWLWQATEGQRVRDLLIGMGVIASVPLVSSIPFLAWDARAFVLSILFSTTRSAFDTSQFPAAVGAFAGGNALVSRIAMLALMLILFAFAWRMRGVHYAFAFLVMLVFVSFNPVLFVQYILWLIPLALLLLSDLRGRVPNPDSENKIPLARD